VIGHACRHRRGAGIRVCKALLGPPEVVVHGALTSCSGTFESFEVKASWPFERVEDGRVDLVWPRGFSAWLRDGETEIVAPDGSAIAREGDVISERLVGVESGICQVDGVLYPPAS